MSITNEHLYLSLTRLFIILLLFCITMFPVKYVLAVKVYFFNIYVLNFTEYKAQEPLMVDSYSQIGNDE